MNGHPEFIDMMNDRCLNDEQRCIMLVVVLRFKPRVSPPGLLLPPDQWQAPHISSYYSANVQIYVFIDAKLLSC